MKKKYLALGLLGIALLLPEMAMADATPQDDLVALVNSLHSPLIEFKNKLAGNGKNLALALMALHVGTAGLKLASGTTDLWEVTLQLMKLLFVGGLVLAAVEPQPWLSTMTGVTGQSGNGITLPDAIMSGMYQLMNLAGGISPWMKTAYANTATGAGAATDPLFLASSTE